MRLRGLLTLCIVSGYLILLPVCLHGQISDTVLTFQGMCDASGVVFVDSLHFFAVNDEDNGLRCYRLDQPGPPVGHLRFDGWLRLDFDRENPEVDWEGMTRMGRYVLAIGSHGRNKKGMFRPNRHRMACWLVENRGGIPRLTPAGEVERNLMEAICADPRHAGFGLDRLFRPDQRQVRTLSPEEDGVNIEGFSRHSDGHSVWIGFRNPCIRGRALLVRLMNPLDVCLEGEKPVFGAPVLLDLGGLGIRSMEYDSIRALYWIAAGPADGSEPYRLITWSGESSGGDGLNTVPFNRPHGFRPEGLTVMQDGRLFLLSDDGTRKMPDPRRYGATCRCKDLKDPTLRMFRTWIDRPDTETTP